MIVPEAESVHVGLDLPAGEVFTAVTVALLQLVRPSLPPEDVDGVHAALGALPAPEHGPAELVVVLQGLGAGGVGRADPPGLGAGDLGLGLDGVGHGVLARLDIALDSLTLLVAGTIALQRKKTKGS